MPFTLTHIAAILPDGLPTLSKFWRVSVCLIGLLIPLFVTLFVWTFDRRTPYAKSRVDHSWRGHSSAGRCADVETP